MTVAGMQFLAACLALAGSLFLGPLIHVQSVRAELPFASDVTVCDVSLDAAHRLRCQFILSNQEPLAGRVVQLECAGDPVASGLTNANGVVEFTGLTCGQYVLQTEFGCSHLRLWDVEAAPPHAMRQLTIQPQDVVMRGQCPNTLVGPHSVMFAVLIAAAIAVPLAVHDAGDFPPGS